MVTPPLRSASVKMLVVCAVAVFAVVSVVGFLLIPLSPAFWIAYAFTGLSYVCVVAVGAWPSASRNSALLHMLPAVTVAVIYAALQSVTGLVLALARPQPHIALVVCLVLALLAIIVLMPLRTASDTVESVECNVADKCGFRSKLLLQLTVCKANLTSEMPRTKTLLRNLDEMVRYSDPMGTPETNDLEQKLMNHIEELSLVIASDGTDTSNLDDKAAELCRKTTDLLVQRNKLCKMTK